MTKALFTFTALAVAVAVWSLTLLPYLEPHGSGGFALRHATLITSLALVVVHLGVLIWSIVVGVRRLPLLVGSSLSWILLASIVLKQLCA